jgi:DNA repair protein RadA/Sms
MGASMATKKIAYACTECGATFSKWSGQCAACGAWNTLGETVVDTALQARSSRFSGYEGTQSQVQSMAEVQFKSVARINTGLSELDRALGGGLVPGSVVLVGGDPGVGKSTLLLQTLCHLSQQLRALYVTGEESLEQVTMRARRLGLPDQTLRLLAETQVERITSLAAKERPQVMVIDSIQTMYVTDIPSAPGGVTQVRESAAQLVHYAKQTGTAVFMVGHVTKEGMVAGPRVLEHIVDTVLFFEGQTDGRFRAIRSVKNRFGAMNELGVFAMTEKGLREVKNPSAIFLSRLDEPVPGSVVMVTWEGSRPLLVEVQVLVDESHIANPRRVTVGLEQNRLAMLLAVLHRHGGVATYDQDVFVNVVGGVRVMETSVDLAVLLAVVSSLRNRALPGDLVVFGEVGLAGEVRPVPSGQERLREAAKHGFKRAIVPKANAPKRGIEGMEIVAVQRLSEALEGI